MKTLHVCLATVLFLSVLTTAPCRAGHPLGTEDAGTVGKGKVEMELNYEDGHFGGEGESSVGNTWTVGAAPRTDVAVTFPYHFHRGGEDGTLRGMGDVEVALKQGILEGKELSPALAVKGGVTLPTGDHEKGMSETGRVGTFLVLVASVERGDLVLHGNLGGRLSGRSLSPGSHRVRDDSAFASLAAEYVVRAPVTLVGEGTWEKNTGAGERAAATVLLGSKAEAFRGVTLDAGVRWGLTDTAPDVTWLAGVTVAFGDLAEGGAEKK